MAQKNRANMLTDIVSNIYNNLINFITGQNAQDRFVNLLDSSPNILSDASQPNGYVSTDANNEMFSSYYDEEISRADLITDLTANLAVGGKFYRINDAVGSTITLLVIAESNLNLYPFGIDATTGEVGVYDITTDVFSPIVSSAQTLAQTLVLGNTSGANDIEFDAAQGLLFANTSRLREGTIDAGLGGTKGIAQICAVGYELKWEAGRLYVMDGNGTGIRQSLYNFTTTPTVTDDTTKGYAVGSLWTLDDGTVYVCSDATLGAAVWAIGGTPDLQQVTDVGFTTTNKLKSDNGAGSSSTLNSGTIDLTTGGATVNIDASLVTTAYNAQLPDKLTSPQTFAMLSDIGAGSGTVTSVGLSMPSAFSVASSPVTTSGTIAVTGAGLTSQYVRGDGSLANFPTSGGGGASVNYYLNGSVTQGTFGGVGMREMNKVPIIGTGTDFTIAADGYIQSFITDANDPNQLTIPAGNWNFETYFSASSGGGSPSFYIELHKWNGTTLTLIASNSATPEAITGGTAIDIYTTALAIPQTTLALTDRLAIRIYVTHSGRTITLHTENSHLCQVITTFTTGLTALNGLTEQVQTFAVGTTGTDFAISSASGIHNFNLPTASASNRGALSSADWSAFNAKKDTQTLTCFGLQLAITIPDAASYHFGTIIAIPASIDARRAFKFTSAGTVTAASFTLEQVANASGETVNIYLRNVTTATDTSIGTFTSNFGTSTTLKQLFSGLSIAVNTTDDYTIKITTPTWATNPSTWTPTLTLQITI